MTALSPPTPSDDELRQWQFAARSGFTTTPVAKDMLYRATTALLGEREAHSATRARLAKLERAANDVLKPVDAMNNPGRPFAALAAALASKESNSE